MQTILIFLPEMSFFAGLMYHVLLIDGQAYCIYFTQPDEFYKLKIF